VATEENGKCDKMDGVKVAGHDSDSDLKSFSSSDDSYVSAWMLRRRKKMSRTYGIRLRNLRIPDHEKAHNPAPR